MKRASSPHDALQAASPFHPFHAPEMTKDHEITGSLVRNLIGITEADGLRAARQFKKSAEKASDAIDSTATIELRNVVARSLLNHLKTPPSVGSSGTPSIPVLIPLTPAMAQITAFSRLSGSPWNSGAYLKGMVLRGSTSRDEAQEMWTDLGEAFAIGRWTEARDDIWATLIEEVLSEDFDTCIKSWSGAVDDIRTLPGHPGPDELNTNPCPARSFVEDLRLLIELKPTVTRRQWLSILDSFFRLALASDLLWIGHINQGLRSELQRHLAGDGEVSLPSEIADNLLPEFHPITIGDHVPTTLTRETQGYVQSRLFIRLLLEDLRHRHEHELERVLEDGGLSSPAGICRLLQVARQHGDAALSERISRRVGDICNNEPDLMQCDQSGTITANFAWCIRHALGQRHTREDADSHFDQGYWCKKSGRFSAAPWLFEPGPVALITFAHLACSGIDGLGTVTDFRRRLAQYGVNISEDELNNGTIGHAIRSLGLVIDSPDAEGGMLIRSPFGSGATTS